jgi:DNA polymerase-1
VKVLARYGIDVAPIDDTMLMSYAMNAGLHGHGMDALSERYLGHHADPDQGPDRLGQGADHLRPVPIDKAAPYAAEDADVTLRLWHLFKPQLHRAQVTTVYETLERPLVPCWRGWNAGIKVDRDTLSRMSNAFAQKMAGLEAEIHELAGETFNVGSPAQLGRDPVREDGAGGRQEGQDREVFDDRRTCSRIWRRPTTCRAGCWTGGSCRS